MARGSGAVLIGIEHTVGGGVCVGGGRKEEGGGGGGV